MRALVIGLVMLTTTAQGVTAQTPRLVNGTWEMPGPSHHAPAASGGGYEAAAYEAAAYYGISGDWLYNIMMCESGGDPGAIGPNGERGVMQVDPRYWDAAWYDPVSQIWWSASMLAAGRSDMWVCA
jgi:hypothetical protein